MAVYVDHGRWPYGRMLMAHMIADSVEELHEMAARLGLKRKWFQISRSGIPHYDICQAKRSQAIALGATALDRREYMKVANLTRQ